MQTRDDHFPAVGGSQLPVAKGDVEGARSQLSQLRGLKRARAQQASDCVRPLDLSCLVLSCALESRRVRLPLRGKSAGLTLASPRIGKYLGRCGAVRTHADVQRRLHTQRSSTLFVFCNSTGFLCLPPRQPCPPHRVLRFTSGDLLSPVGCCCCLLAWVLH